MVADDGTLLIFDCGTGARKLGLSFARKGPVRAHLLLSHTHGDHILGLPFFLPAFTPGSHLTIYGPAGVDRALSEAVSGSMDYAYFPVPLSSLPARFDFVELDETEFTIGKIRVRTQFLNHTAPTVTPHHMNADESRASFAKKFQNPCNTAAIRTSTSATTGIFVSSQSSATSSQTI